MAALFVATLLVGETVELAWPAVHWKSLPGTWWPMVFQRLGAVSEVCAIVGSIAALGWALRATVRSAGGPRARRFATLPLMLAPVVPMIAGVLGSQSPAAARAAASTVFGVRFDLLRTLGARLTPGWVLVYMLIPQLLLAAAVVSVGSIGTDRGAGGRRAAGLTCVLLAGHGALRLTGPMLDPMRVLMVVLAAVLLERAIVFEADERTRSGAPAA